MIVKPELQQFGDLGSQALGVLFMKFGRDDETQADGLGFRYMTNLNYEPSEMAEMFRTLDRMGGGSQRTPEWLSTHPDPGNRVQKTQQRIAAWTRPAGQLKIERDSYLRRIDGLVFGDDPRAGYFQQNVFLHPTLKFRMDFPSGWRTANQASQVLGVSSAQDAMLVVSAGTGSASQALQQFLSQQGLTSSGASNTRINGLTAATAQFSAQTQQGILMGWVGFIELDGSTYRMLAYTGQQQFRSYDQVFRNAMGSFQRLTDPAALNVKPNRVRLVETPSAMTLEQFNSRYPSTIPMDKLALINGYAGASATIPAKTLVKRVVAQ
jgi:predicted Zn-dependent protease